MPEDKRPLELRPGEVLSAQASDGRSVYFEVTRRLASGGEGVVYEAMTDDGVVAVVKGPLYIGVRDLSLEREARHLEALGGHPNVIQFLAALKDPRGHTLLFLERAFDNPLRFLNRDAVKERLATRPKPKKAAAQPTRPAQVAPPLATGLELAYDLARALEHLHENDLVHGDVKLQNLMVAIDWSGPTIPDRDYCERIAKGRWQGVLIDMGGVRTRKELEAIMRGDKLVKPPKMTAAYAPPEILPGLVDAAGNERSRFTPGMDVYAFGLVLYQLVTGWLPYSHLREPPDDKDLKLLARAKRDERDGAHRAVARAALDSIDWSDSSLSGQGASREAFVEELWGILVKATHWDVMKRARMKDLRAALGALLEVKEIEPEESGRAARRWGQDRVRLDQFSSRLADAGRDGTVEKQDPRTRKIQRRASDFWDSQGLGGGGGGGRSP